MVAVSFLPLLTSASVVADGGSGEARRNGDPSCASDISLLSSTPPPHERGDACPCGCVQRGLLSVFRGNIAPAALDLAGKADLRALLADADLTAGLGRGLGRQSPRARFLECGRDPRWHFVPSETHSQTRPLDVSLAASLHQSVSTAGLYIPKRVACVRARVCERSVISEMQTRRSTWLPQTAGLVGHPHPLRLKLPPSFSSGLWGLSLLSVPVAR